MGTETLELEEELFQRVNQLRSDLGYSWEQAFDLMRMNLRADLESGHNGPPNDMESTAGKAVLRRLDVDGDPDVKILTEQELESRINNARNAGFVEGKEEAKQRWKQNVEEILVNNSLCHRCRTNEAEGLHHIVPREYDGSDQYENKIPLCDGCHDRVEILTTKWLEGVDEYNENMLREYVVDGFPMWVYE